MNSCRDSMGANARVYLRVFVCDALCVFSSYQSGDKEIAFCRLSSGFVASAGRCATTAWRSKFSSKMIGLFVSVF
jgi:hypothetical protein